MFSEFDSMDVGRSGEVPGVVGRVWGAEIICFLMAMYSSEKELKNCVRFAMPAGLLSENGYNSENKYVDSRKSTVKGQMA